MSLRTCRYEAEIRALLKAGQWPLAAPGELREHSASCRNCGELVLLTQAFHADHAAALNEPQLPPPGVLWWRAQLRRRNAAIERISRPILGAQVFAAVAATTSLLAILLIYGRDGLRWLNEASQSGAFHLANFWISSETTHWMGIDWNLAYLLPVLCAAVLVGGVMAYMASEKQ